jgi:hypothetical protein
VKLRGIVNAQWSVAQANVGTAVNLIVDTVGVDNGEKATIDIYVRDSNYTDHLLTTIEGQVSGDQVQASWTLQVEEKYLTICDAKETKKKYSTPYFFYRVKIAELSEQSGLLYWQDWIEIILKDETGKAIAGKKYKAYLPTGEIKQGTLNGQGKAKIQNTTPGKVNVRFTLK